MILGGDYGVCWQGDGFWITWTPAPMGNGGAATGPDRRPARRLAVGTSTRSRDASAVTGAASRVLRLDLLLVTVDMTLRVLSPDSSHLLTAVLRAFALVGPPKTRLVVNLDWVGLITH